MKKHLALIVCLFSGCLLLAGCTDTDWDRALNYGGMAETQVPTPAPPPNPATAAAAPVMPAGEPVNADFCRALATQDASSNGFDRATQTRVYAQRYAQCVTIYTR